MLASHIAAKQFTARRLREGYDPDEVDNFLDEVEADYRRFEAEINSLKDQVKKLTSASTAVIPKVVQPSPVETADRLLRVAEATAQEHIDEAKAKADGIVREGGAQAARLVEDAEKARLDMLAKAREESNAALSLASSEEARIRQRADELSQQITQLEERRRTYKSWLESTLAKMEEEASNG